jgi:hypothetical protein
MYNFSVWSFWSFNIKLKVISKLLNSKKCSLLILNSNFKIHFEFENVFNIKYMILRVIWQNSLKLKNLGGATLPDESPPGTERHGHRRGAGLLPGRSCGCSITTSSVYAPSSAVGDPYIKPSKPPFFFFFFSVFGRRHRLAPPLTAAAVELPPVTQTASTHSAHPRASLGPPEPAQFRQNRPHHRFRSQLRRLSVTDPPPVASHLHRRSELPVCSTAIAVSCWCFPFPLF